VKKLRLIMLSVFLVCFLWMLPWKTFASLVFPGVVLSRTLEDRIEALYRGYADGPAYAITSFLNRYSCYQTNWKLEFGPAGPGDLLLDFRADFQNAPGRVLLTGEILLPDRKTDMGFYLDETILALRSDLLFGERWYGIQYESLYQTICEHPVWTAVLGDRGLQVLDGVITKAGYLLHWEQPVIPVVEPDNILQIGPAALLLDLEAECAYVQRGSGKERAVIMTCLIPGNNLMQALPYVSEYLSDAVRKLFHDDPDTVELEFLLIEGVLYSISWKLADDRVSCTADIRFGREPDSGVIHTMIQIADQKEGTGFHLELEFGNNPAAYDHKITIQTDSWEETGTVVCSYRWNPVGRDLWMMVESEGRCAALYGALEQNSLRVDTADLGALLEILTGRKSSFRAGSLIIQKGSAVAKPECSDVFDPGAMLIE